MAKVEGGATTQMVGMRAKEAMTQTEDRQDDRTRGEGNSKRGNDIDGDGHS